jgi:hypothetical protein
MDSNLQRDVKPRVSDIQAGSTTVSALNTSLGFLANDEQFEAWKAKMRAKGGNSSGYLRSIADKLGEFANECDRSDYSNSPKVNRSPRACLVCEKEFYPYGKKVRYCK